MVNIYEKELYKFIKKTIFYEPLKIILRENLEIDIINFILNQFKIFFLLNIDVFNKNI